MIQTLASVILSFIQQTGSVFFAVGIFTVLTCVFSYPLTKKSVENMLLSPLLRQEMREAYDLHKKHPELAQAVIQKQFAFHHYGMFASCICTLVQGGLGVVLALSFQEPTLSSLCLWGSSLSASPLAQQTELSLILVMAAVAHQLIHDQLMEQELVTDQRVPDLLLLVLAAAGCLLLPAVFSLYWLLHELADLAMMLAITTLGRERFLAREAGRGKPFE